MKRLLNEEFLYNGDLYFIKSIVETFQPYIYVILAHLIKFILFSPK